jgi:ubiquitin conjugation factor E4 B
VLDHITFVIEFSHGRLELIQQQLDTDPQYTEGPYWASHEHTFATLPAFEKSAVEFLHLCTTSSGLFGLSQLLLRPEIVTRVAQVLNFCLDRFIGRKYQAIEQTAQALMLDRSQLARVVGRTYLYLLPAQFPKECGSVPHSLVEAMCADPSQFELEWFSEKLAMLPDTNPDSVTLYAQFVNDLKTGIDQLHAMDDLLGEIPEEFECTLMGTLMIDPVILPTSNITVDRASIERHLISSETDPFNRQFLSISMLKPNAELKQRLQDWKKAKQAQPRPLPTPVVEQAVVAEAQVPPAVNNSNAVLESKQEDTSMDTG